MAKKTLVLGATDNPNRYAWLAATRLQDKGHEVIPVGLNPGKMAGLDILVGQPQVKDVDTVTIYVNPKRQQPLVDYVLELKPKRVIFNPGAENQEFEAKLKQNGIEAIEACTLVLLSIGKY